MHCYLIITVAVSLFIHTLAELQDLSTAQDYLNPLNDPENTNTSSKYQDKRTIFNPTIQNYAWAKHVAIRPWGNKQVLGYGPVDLRYTPVLRPIAIKHHGYHYDRPKIHFHLKRPVAIPVIQTGWKPIIPAVKPVVPVHIPPATVIAKPVHPVHIDHVHTGAHVDQVHLNPVPHVDHVHQEPHVHPVHVQPAPINLPHVDHIHTVAHIPQAVPVQHVPVVPRPVVPAPSVFEVTRPDLGVLPIGTVFSSPVLKEIPAPQLRPVVVPQPVHPIAAPPVHHVHAVPQAVTHLHPVPDVQIPHFHQAPHVQHFPEFPIPHFHQAPHVNHFPEVPVPHLHQAPHIHPEVPHLHQAAHVHHYPEVPVPHLHQAPHVHHFPEVPATHLHPVQPIPQPHIHQHLVQQPVLPPGFSVDYHGSTNFLNFFKGPTPVVSQPELPHVHQVQPPAMLPNHFNFDYPQIPQNVQPQQPHDVQTSIIQAGFDNTFPNQQHPPINDQVNFQLNNQNAPQPQDFSQPDQPRFQPADQVSSQHYFQGSQASDQLAQQGYVYPRPEQSIQPGQTDVQFPLHLPQHPGFHHTQRNSQDEDYEDSRFSEEEPRESRFTEIGFKPSIQLEPPFK